MPNVDDKGNKLAQKREKKSVVAKNFRIKAAQKAGEDTTKGIKSNVCDECGYRIRTVAHLRGKHHKEGLK